MLGGAQFLKKALIYYLVAGLVLTIIILSMVIWGFSSMGRESDRMHEDLVKQEESIDASMAHTQSIQDRIRKRLSEGYDKADQSFMDEDRKYTKTQNQDNE